METLVTRPCARVRNVGTRNAELKKSRTLDTESVPPSTGPGDFARRKAIFWGSCTRKRDPDSVRYTRHVVHHQPGLILRRRRYHTRVAVGLNLSTTRHLGCIDWAARRQYQPATSRWWKPLGPVLAATRPISGTTHAAGTQKKWHRLTRAPWASHTMGLPTSQPHIYWATSTAPPVSPRSNMSCTRRVAPTSSGSHPTS